jgi:hypothetical protein
MANSLSIRGSANLTIAAGNRIISKVSQHLKRCEDYNAAERAKRTAHLDQDTIDIIGEEAVKRTHEAIGLALLKDRKRFADECLASLKEDRDELATHLAVVRDGAALVDSPRAYLSFAGLGSEKAQAYGLQLQHAGAAALKQAAQLAISRNDMDLGFAVCARLDGMSPAERKRLADDFTLKNVTGGQIAFTANHLAEALCGVAFRAVQADLAQVNEAVQRVDNELVSLAREAVSGRPTNETARGRERLSLGLDKLRRDNPQQANADERSLEALEELTRAVHVGEAHNGQDLPEVQRVTPPASTPTATPANPRDRLRAGLDKLNQ